MELKRNCSEVDVNTVVYLYCCKIVFNTTHCSFRHKKPWKWLRLSALHFLVPFSSHLFWTLLFLFWKKKIYRIIVISCDAGRQKTVFFSLTLLTLQARNCRDAVLIGKLSKFDMGVRTENCIQLLKWLFVCVCIYVYIYTQTTINVCISPFWTILLKAKGFLVYGQLTD